MQLETKMDMDFSQPIYIDGAASTIVQTDGTYLEVMLHDEITHLPPRVRISQEKETAKPDEVAQQLTRYWAQFWNRDTIQQQSSIEHWSEFEVLKQQITAPTQVDIRQTHLPDWKDAIRQISSTTARGCCGWAADELKQLPDNCVADLMFTLQKYVCTGFPDWLMKATVLPVAKTYKADKASATRPITVLALIYRVWSKVMTKQILRTWARIMPKPISGFLPGRSAHDLIYDMQLSLEATNHGFSDLHWGGLTLDIVKCFNTLPMQPLKSILVHLGIPLAVVQLWSMSITKMVRHWMLDFQLFEVPQATTGVPEGDSWSVLARLGINYLVVFHLQPLVDRLNTYADNWAYATSQPTQHTPAIQKILQISHALSIAIDWSKTWAWGTSQSHKDALKEAKDRCLDQEVQLRQVLHARDLGYIMHYRLMPFRGTQKERHKQVLTRLTRLRRADLTLETKAYIAMTAGITKALYGCHTYMVGERYFEQLRSRIAEALLGDHHNIQSHLACMVLDKTLVDPEFWIIKQAVVAARQFLLNAPHATRKLFFRMAAQNSARYNHICGPAMALGAYLAKVGWQITRDGALHGLEHQTFHLLTSNLEDIFSALEISWMEHVAMHIATRKGMHHVPPIDRHATVKVFQKIAPEKQLSVGLDITMGYMLNQQKANFDEMQPETCDFCDQVDSVQHRVLECQATAMIRQRYSSVCEFLQEHDQVHNRLPAVYLNPEIAFSHFVLENFPKPHKADLPYLPQYWFTDGACSLPTEEQCRWASFSVVATRCTLDHFPEEKLNDAHWILHNCFDTVIASHVIGRQTVPRAELMAAVEAHEIGLDIPVVTDSQYVVDMHAKILATEHVWKLHKKKNYDLLVRLHCLHWQHGKQLLVIKVKAHKSIRKMDSQAFFQVGNSAADAAAVLTHKTLAKPLTTELQRLAVERQQNTRLLYEHYNMRYELSEMRKRLQTEAVIDSAVDTREEFFREYSIADPEQFTFSTESWEIVHASRWGTVFSALVMKWLEQLKWPRQPDRRKPPVGITWLELACNFMLTTQHTIPIDTATSGPAIYRCVEEDETLDHRSYSFTLATNSFRDCLSHLIYLTQEKALPTMKSLKVTSLRQLGGRASKQGIAFRPQLPLQSQTVSMLKEYFNVLQGSRNFELWPTVPEAEPCVLTSITAIPGDNLEQKMRRYHRRRMAIKRNRQS